MNIIQIQDDLKGLPDQELINEVQAPSGVAPVYLLLGELQRREKMRAEHAGKEQPTQTVAEQIIEEAIAPAPPMPMGGSPIPPGPGQAMPPQPIPPANQVMPPNIDPNMLASSGVGALPAPNVGQYSEGGVVGFQDGGFFDEGVGEAERRARSVRPETQTAENYFTGLQAEGLAFQEGRKLNPSEGWSNLISSIPREEDLQDRRNFDSSNLISRIPRDNQTADQYAEGGVVGFDNGGMFGRGIEEAERRGIVKRMPLSPENVGNLDNRGSGGFFEFDEGVGEAERTARAVRPEIQTAENYNANFDDFGGLSQLIKLPLGGSIPRGALRPLFKRMGKQNPEKSGLMRLLSGLDLDWTRSGEDLDYAQGGVVGFAPGGQTKFSDPGQEPEELGQGYWKQYLTEEVPKYWRDVYEEKVPESLRQTIEGVPQVAREQLEAVVESPVGQTVGDIPRVAKEQAEAAGEIYEAWPYPRDFQEAGEEMTYGQDVAGEGTGVTSDQYADPSVTVESRGIPGIDTPMKGIGSLLDKIPGYSLYDIPGVDARALDETFEATGRGLQVAPKGTEGREDERPFMDKVWEKAKAGSGWFGDWDWGDKTIDKKDDGKKKEDKGKGKAEDKDAEHWRNTKIKQDKLDREAETRFGIEKGSYQKLLEKTIADSGGSGLEGIKGSAAEVEKMLHDMNIYDSKADERAAKVAARIQNEQTRAGWNAVTMAGLSMMQGDSQFALTNIGKGIEDGIGAYEKSEQKIADLEDKKLELEEKKATREREKKIQSLTFAVDLFKSEQSNISAQLTAAAELQSKASIANANNLTKEWVANKNYDARTKAAMITSGKSIYPEWEMTWDSAYKDHAKGTPEYLEAKNAAWLRVLQNIEGKEVKLPVDEFSLVPNQ